MTLANKSSRFHAAGNAFVYGALCRPLRTQEALLPGIRGSSSSIHAFKKPYPPNHIVPSLTWPFGIVRWMGFGVLLVVSRLRRCGGAGCGTYFGFVMGPAYVDSYAQPSRDPDRCQARLIHRASA